MGSLVALQRRWPWIWRSLALLNAALAMHLCPDIDNDPHGQWEGSREVGGNFTLSCEHGFKVPGTSGKSTVTLTCPENLEWTEVVRCENIDDCARLKHGCGAFGVCSDKVGGYVCNCEHGYPPRPLSDGEIICGNQETDEALCGGHTCGAYGVCIDLQGDFPEFEHPLGEGVNRSNLPLRDKDITYKCECTDGYFDNGNTCVPYDCGPISDELGKWTGSTLFGGEYTLECPSGAFIWSDSVHTTNTRITVSCGKKGKWLSRPLCHSEAKEEEAEEMEKFRRWSCLGAVAICVCSAALAAGLTLGLATLEPFVLTVMLATNPEHCASHQLRQKLHRERSDARRVLPLVQDHHQLLVTLLLFNTVANESLPIFLDELVPSWAAVLLSVSVVLFCGEILPSAVFTGPSQMKIAAACVPLVKALQAIFYVIANPIARLLDQLIEHDDAEDGIKYSRAELLALLQLHGQQPNIDASEGLEEDDQTAPVMRDGEDSNGSGPPSGNRGALRFFCGGDDPENSEELEEQEEPSSCLAASELQLINGAMSLRDVELEGVPFARLHECALVNEGERASEVIAKRVLRPGVRAVLVTKSQSSRQRPGSAGDVTALPLLPTNNVLGCLRPVELLHAGGEQLGSVCSQPLVLVPTRSTALEALHCFRGARGRAGLVVSNGEVHGVVTGVDILKHVMRGTYVDDGSIMNRSPSRSPGDPLSPLPSVPSTDTYFGMLDDDGSPRKLPRGKSHHRMQLGRRIAPRSTSLEQVLGHSYSGEGVGKANSFGVARRGAQRIAGRLATDISP